MRKTVLIAALALSAICASVNQAAADYAAAAMAPSGKGGMTWNHSSRMEAEAQAYNTCRKVANNAVCSTVKSVNTGWILGMYCTEPSEEVFLVAGDTLEEAFSNLRKERAGFSKCVLKIRVNSEGLHQ